MFALLCLVSAIATSHALLSPRISKEKTQLFNAGGWGIGPQRDLTDDEFLRGDRRAFSGYELQPDFGKRVEAESKSLRDEEMKELMGVAAAAGININNEPKLNKFSKDDYLDDEDDLDLSVDWGDNNTPDATANSGDDESITRLDEDTGALGTW